MATTDTAAALEQASRGLTYQSETDAPWTVVSWPSAEGEPAGEAVKKKGRHRADAPVKAQTLDDFFAPLVEDKDWYGGEEKAVAAHYRSLLNVIRGRLTVPKVFRVGERRVAVYLIGQAKEGGWAGLKTTAVET